MEIKFTENFIDLCENLSQKELADRIGINQSQISRYVKGVIPSTYSVVKICDYFGCSVDYLVGLNDDKTYKTLNAGFNAETFYERYNSALKKRKTSHYQLARQGVVCETSLRLWKKGMLPQFQALYNIAVFLGVSIDYLIGRTDTM